MTSGAPTQQQSSIEIANHRLGEAIAKFDPFRFRAWSELGLTTAQLRVMFYMRETPGVTAGELAGRLSVTPPTISGIVERLVRLGLVERRDDPADRRLVRNFLTPAGEDACSRLEEGGALFTHRILREMSDGDRLALIRGLEAFIRASEHVRCVQPDLAVVAMPGGNQ